VVDECPEPLVRGLLARPERGDVIGAGVNGEVNYTDLKNRACSSDSSLAVRVRPR